MLKVPVLSVVIGEGGSGGALALAVANQVWMLENAVYSVLSPEGFAAILWKDGKRVQEAAEVMKITAADLLQMGVIDRIIREDGEVPESRGKETSISREKGNQAASRKKETPDYDGAESVTANREHMEGLALTLKERMLEFLDRYEGMEVAQIVAERQNRFRRM